MNTDLLIALREASKPVLQIDGVTEKLWRRNVRRGARVGPWRSLKYSAINPALWRRRGPCLYFASDSAQKTVYIGISKNRFADRWRLSPAFDPASGELLPHRELFHSQCQRHIQADATKLPVLVSMLPEADALAIARTFGQGPSSLSGLEASLIRSASESSLTWNTHHCKRSA